MTLQYVGGKISAVATTGATVSLTDLTGGLASAPAAGDIVIVAMSCASNGNRTLTVSSGYTELAELFINDDKDANLSVNYKIMGSTPDTSFTTNNVGSSASGTMIAVHVWRGVDQTTPMDVTATTATNLNTGTTDPPSITPVTAGAVVIAVGHAASATAANYTSSDLSNFLTGTSSNTHSNQTGIGSIAWSGSGAVNPAAFGGGSNTTSDSMAALCLALRPAENVYKGADWTAKYKGSRADSSLYFGINSLH